MTLCVPGTSTGRNKSSWQKQIDIVCARHIDWQKQIKLSDTKQASALRERMQSERETYQMLNRMLNRQDAELLEC